jgi:hypothetical protein
MDLPTQLLAERFLQLVTKQMARNLVDEFVQADQAASVSAIELYVSQACDMYLGGPTDPMKVATLRGISVPPGADYQLALEWAKDRMIEVYNELVEVARHPNLWQKPLP